MKRTSGVTHLLLLGHDETGTAISFAIGEEALGAEIENLNARSSD